jgi:phospholipid/cholesterol/gamma-HCH transport system substrate-binding protein
LTKLGDVGDSLANGLSMLATFPFPKEAANIVRGDYANALFQMDINLNTIIKSPGDALPNLINLCSAFPLNPVCQGLSPVLKATVCKAIPPDQAAVLCPEGASARKGKSNPVPGLGLPGRSGSSGSSGGGSGDLGGLLGGGGGG